jgi:XisH protein
MARDLIHNIVKNALINDGWNITHDPYPVKIGGFDMEIDLGAENLVAAEREGEKIAIESDRRCGKNIRRAFESL